MSAYHLSVQVVRIAQIAVGALHVALPQQVADQGGADGDSVHPERRRLDDFHPQLFSVTAVILEPFTAVVPETVVIADYQYLDMEAVVQLPHKVAGREERQLLREREQEAVVGRLAEQELRFL